MPKYRFKAKNIENKILRGVYVAQDDDDLREIISNQGFFLISFRKIPESAQLFSFLEKIKPDDLTAFCRQFSIMVTAGIEISDCIATLRDNTKVKKLKTILEDVHKSLMEGVMLSEAFAKYPKTFPQFFTNMIYIGELSGNMDFVLNRLADYYENDAKVKKKVKSSLQYPKILLLLSVAVVIVLSVFVMPMFSDLFSGFDADLPPLTRTVNNVTFFVRDNIGLLLAGAIVVYILLTVFGRTKIGRQLFDLIKLKAPVIKNVTISTVTARFARGFGVLVESGMQIIDSIEIIGRLLGNVVVEKQFQIVTSEIKRGQPIAKSLETIDVFPEMLIEMVKVGEESGAIDKVLNKTANYFDDQVTNSIQKMTTLIEPMFILTVAGIVVVILLSVFLPMMGLMDAIEGSVG
ncbi:MAG: type II secretion system F family protein [Bacilli bacterium]|nr:type II secretion system F family protein [Bacilli bacterium]HRU49709.1 type II secretion system F family protein [Bacilli bacterium]